MDSLLFLECVDTLMSAYNIAETVEGYYATTAPERLATLEEYKRRDADDVISAYNLPIYW